MGEGNQFDQNVSNAERDTMIILDFRCEILSHLKINYSGNCWRKKCYYLYLFLCYFVSCPKNLKLLIDLTKLCNFVNKDYDYNYNLKASFRGEKWC